MTIIELLDTAAIDFTKQDDLTVLLLSRRLARPSPAPEWPETSRCEWRGPRAQDACAAGRATRRILVPAIEPDRGIGAVQLLGHDDFLASLDYVREVAQILDLCVALKQGMIGQRIAGREFDGWQIFTNAVMRLHVSADGPQFGSSGLMTKPYDGSPRRRTCRTTNSRSPARLVFSLR